MDLPMKIFDPLAILNQELSQLNLRDFAELVEDGWKFLNNPVSGYETPWKNIGDLFKFVPGEVTLLSGYTGQGKSEIVTHMAIHAISQGARAMIASLEMSAGQIHSRITKQVTGCDDITRQYYERVSNHFKDKLYIFDTRGVADIKKILEGGRLLNGINNYDFFVFDNLMMLDSKSDDYNKQLENVQLMVEFAKTLNVCVVLVAHSRKPNNKSGDGRITRDFSPPGIYEVMGASGVANLVDNHISLTINTTKKRALDKLANGADVSMLTESELNSLEMGDSILKRDKKREYGDYFLKYLYYDKRFRVLKDFESQQPKVYVD
jgi:hypothetical protein